MTLPAQTVHHIPGRLRLQVDQPLVFNGHRPGFEATLRELPAVTNVRLNPTCQSVVLDYDPARTSGEVLAAQVGQLSLERLASPASAPAEEEDESSWVSLALAAGALVLGAPLAPWLMGAAAVPIFRRAYDAFVERGRPNVDALDASATLALLLQGQVQTASLMVLLVALGHAIADYTLYQSRRALEGLYDGTGELAWVVRRGRTCRVRVEEIQPGEQVVVYPGELIPVDGTVAAGTATVDQTALTGESLPVAKAPGSEVLAATVVREGKLYVTATKIGQQTRAARIVRLVREAPIRETRIQNYAEQFADDLVPWTFAGAGALMGLGNMQGASSVLIVDYATGIRIAAPTAVLSSMARAARQGILIKGGRTLERLAAVDAIVFDKTGTLTLGTQEIIEVVPYGAGRSADRVLAFAAAAEQRLTHPVAVAIVGTARARRLRIPARKSSEYQIGMGVKAQVNGNTVLVGAVRFLEAHGVPVDRAAADLAEAERRAASPVLVAVDGELAGLLLYVDPVRPEAAEVVSALREGGIHELVMLTGDSRAVAGKVAAEL
ncbi:MAG TPA: heavy metal translocating P-type ATPase, partial [Candidatus Sulfotelmatobacter sp.]|nr:heavy metal translocating P-type ATPase [Candidatus Sulfotelmatobacter sp.]